MDDPRTDQELYTHHQNIHEKEGADLAIKVWRLQINKQHTTLTTFVSKNREYN